MLNAWNSINKVQYQNICNLKMIVLTSQDYVWYVSEEFSFKSNLKVHLIEKKLNSIGNSFYYYKIFQVFFVKPINLSIFRKCHINMISLKNSLFFFNK